MLACTRLGAVHSVVFAGFSSESLRDRIIDANRCVSSLAASRLGSLPPAGTAT
jgi:acyl-coenzyme A synthetase/AMP-(fatty) acid ligase